MVLKKDEQSSVGKNYLEKCSKHIYIRYFFATYKIDKRELKLSYCTTDKINADFSMKPLQGATFIEFCNKNRGFEWNILMSIKGNTQRY